MMLTDGLPSWCYLRGPLTADYHGRDLPAQEDASCVGRAGRASSASPVGLGVRGAQRHAQTRLFRVWFHRAALRAERSVEQHLLDALVVVEVLDVPQIRRAGRDLCVQVRRAVAGNLHVERRSQSSCLQESGDAPAPGDVRLKAVNR